MIKTRDMIILSVLACLSLIISLATHSGSDQIEEHIKQSRKDIGEK